MTTVRRKILFGVPESRGTPTNLFQAEMAPREESRLTMASGSLYYGSQQAHPNPKMVSTKTSAPPPTIRSSNRTLPSLVFTSRNLSIVVVGAVLLCAILRADQKDIPRIVEIIFGSNTFGAVGWVLAGGILIGAIIMIRFMKSSYDRELERVAKERDTLQERLIRKED